jgi:nucleoside phosphorylase
MISGESLSVDVCVVCALAEEARAFIEVVSEQQQTSFTARVSPQYRYDYRFATIRNSCGETLTLHVSLLPRYGLQEMMLHLSRVLAEYRPRLAAMTGICAGDKRRVALGDLIVAERTFTFDAGSIEIDEDGYRIPRHDTQTYQPDENILSFVKMFDQWQPLVAQLVRPPSKRQQRDWLLNRLLNEQTPSVEQIPLAELEHHAPAWRRIVHELQRGPDPLLSPSMELQERDRIGRLHYGVDPFPYTDRLTASRFIKPMASGNAVHRDDPFADVQIPVRGAVAIDMEGAAFGRTMASFPHTSWLVVKGVSDYADSDKDDSYHHYASSASARYLLSFIKDYVTRERLPPFHELSSNIETFTRHIDNKQRSACPEKGAIILKASSEQAGQRVWLQKREKYESNDPTAIMQDAISADVRTYGEFGYNDYAALFECTPIGHCVLFTVTDDGFVKLGKATTAVVPSPYYVRVLDWPQ